MYVKLSGEVVFVRSDGKKVTFTTFSSLQVKRSAGKLNTECRLTLPTSARLRYAGENRSERAQTAKQFNRGDRIEVWVAYNDGLQREFSGYIFRIDFTQPLEVVCEGYEFELRTACPTKTFGSTTLKELVQYVISDTTIELAGDIPTVSLSKYTIPTNLSKLEVLQKLMTTYGLTAFFDEHTLHVGLAYLPDLGTVKYRLGYNTILKGDKLKYRNAEDVRMQVKAVSVAANNTKMEVEVGDSDGVKRTLFFYNIPSSAELKKIAEAEIQKYKYSGYEGKIQTFLTPFAKPGMRAELSDPEYSERDGVFFVAATELKVDNGGARRTVELTIKL